MVKKLDWLSPPITLYFKGEGQHSSLFSAILSVIIYILVLISGIYYSLGFINKDSPKAYFFNRYIEDAGYFPVNSSSMFHFIQIIDQRTEEIIGFDFTVFRAIGIDDLFYDEYMNNPNNLSNVNHWVYGYCNNNTDTEGIDYLINFDLYNQSSCIRKYYDKDKKQYYNTGEEGFRWPIIEKGCSNKNRTYYGIILQRCDKSPDIIKSQGPNCKTESEITEIIQKVSLKFQIIDHYADMLNYQMPFTKYFYEVTSAITNGVYIINHLNFNPANMLTHNGILFDSQKQERSYFFTQNEKHTIDKSILNEGQSTNGCLIGIYFWMQNTLQYYERSYDRLQDVLSDIGGISSIVVTVAYYINLLVNNFIILLDTEDLIIKRDKDNFDGRNSRKRPTIIRKVNEMKNPPKKEYKFQKLTYIENIQRDNNSSSNHQGFINDGIDIFQNNNYIPKNNENRRNFRCRSSILKNNCIENNNNIESSHYYIKENPRIFTKRRTVKFTKVNNFTAGYKDEDKNHKLNFKHEDTNESQSDVEHLPLMKQNFNWFKYIWYLLCCETNDKKISYYEHLRSSLISEENIIQSYLDVYQLLKVNKIQKKNIFHL